jgi:hypothetical protein
MFAVAADETRCLQSASVILPAMACVRVMFVNNQVASSKLQSKLRVVDTSC